jgi:hypothetical protein
VNSSAGCDGKHVGKSGDRGYVPRANSLLAIPSGVA